MKGALAVFVASYSVAASAGCITPPPSGYESAMTVDWNDGIPAFAGVQASTPQSLFVRAVEGGTKALYVRIDQTDSFSGVANGSPRAEVSLGKVRFENGKDYLLEWSTLLPADFQFDAQQPEIVTQIHQGAASGSPPFALLTSNDHYELNIRSDAKDSLHVFRFGSIASDRGHWVCWRLRYVPDATGQLSVTELSKDGKEVYVLRGAANAYSHDTTAYLKLGIYKWLWHSKPDDIRSRSLAFGNVALYRRKADAAEGGVRP